MIILGSTGSIGENALRLARRFGVRVRALACRASVARLNEQIAEFAPRFVCVRDEAAARGVVGVPRGRVFSGADGVVRMLEACRGEIDGADLGGDFARDFDNKVINALVGFSGFMPSVRALELGFELCLANKESLVVGGKFLARLAAGGGANSNLGADGAGFARDFAREFAEKFARSFAGDFAGNEAKNNAQNAAQMLAQRAAKLALNAAQNGVNDALEFAKNSADLARGFTPANAAIAEKIAAHSAKVAQRFAQSGAEFGSNSNLGAGGGGFAGDFVENFAKEFAQNFAKDFVKNGADFAQNLAQNATDFSQNPAQNSAHNQSQTPAANPTPTPAPALAASPRIRPIDSEHFGLAFLLKGRENQARRLVITASGGAFFDLPREQMRAATATAALRHPNWQMGSKITIDSATMANKLFECAEAFWLFGVGEIGAVIERTSTIHALVEFADGSTSAHFCRADMALAIAHAVGLCDGAAGEPAPNSNLDGGAGNLAQNFVQNPANPAQNCPQILPNLDILKLAEIKFQPIDTAKFRIFSLKDELLARTDLGAVINAANEVAVGRFLRGECGFLDIERAVFAAVERFGGVRLNSPQDAFETDAAVRGFCEKDVFGGGISGD